MNVQKIIERIAEDDMTMSARELVQMIKDMLLRRKGDIIDDKVAEERARNIAVALVGYTII